MLHVQSCQYDHIREEGRMVRRFICAVAVFTCAGLYAFAAEQFACPPKAACCSASTTTRSTITVVGRRDEAVKGRSGLFWVAPAPLPLTRVASIEIMDWRSRRPAAVQSGTGEERRRP
jgi:hypothetical protein